MSEDLVIQPVEEGELPESPESENLRIAEMINDLIRQIVGNIASTFPNETEEDTSADDLYLRLMAK